MKQRLDKAIRRTLWVPQSLWERIGKKATQEDRTISSLIRYLLEKALGRD